jgi:hypothetical protein
MGKYSKKHLSSVSSQDEAMKIARGTQRPAQTKEQTRLIAQGIHKGIEQYKKQQNAKARELDKKLKKVSQRLVSPEANNIEVQEKVIYKQHWLPWVLLVLSWLAVAAYWIAN